MQAFFSFRLSSRCGCKLFLISQERSQVVIFLPFSSLHYSLPVVVVVHKKFPTLATPLLFLFLPFFSSHRADKCWHFFQVPAISASEEEMVILLPPLLYLLELQICPFCAQKKSEEEEPSLRLRLQEGKYQLQTGRAKVKHCNPFLFFGRGHLGRRRTFFKRQGREEGGGFQERPRPCVS